MPHSAERRGPVALTGATGFVGRRLLTRLLDQGYEVRALRRHPPVDATAHAAVSWIEGDLQSRDALSALVDGAATVIHVAGATKAINRAAYFEVNEGGSQRLAQCAQDAGARRFIHVSSLAATRPDLSPYAASKAAGEAVVRTTVGPDMGVTIIRPPAVIGPGDPMLAPLLSMVRRGWLPTPADRSGQQRRFAVVGVDDLAQFILDQLDVSPDGPLRELAPCSVASVSWEDVRLAAESVLGRRIRRTPVPGAVLQVMGYGADLLGGLSRRKMPVSAGKVQELLQMDWTCDTIVRNPSSLQHILASSLAET